MTDWLIEAARRSIVDDPCPDGGHCCCCGPGEPCCDCGAVMPADALPDGLIMRDGSAHAKCGVCGCWYEWPVGIEDFDPDEHNYCGGSPRCCP